MSLGNAVVNHEYLGDWLISEVKRINILVLDDIFSVDVFQMRFDVTQEVSKNTSNNAKLPIS